MPNKTLLLENTIEFKEPSHNILTTFNIKLNQFNLINIETSNLILINNFEFEILKFNNNNLQHLDDLFNFNLIKKYSNDYEIYVEFIKNKRNG